MPGADAALAILREWVIKAENDLLAAAHTLKLGRKAPTEVVCFHTQQCAEKYLKSLLVLCGLDVPKTHDLVALAQRLPNGQRRALPMDGLIVLRRYAAVTRYPGAEEIPLAEARRALATVRRIRKTVRSFLPKTALRRKKR